MIMFNNILIPTDGSELSIAAGRHAVDIARAFKTKVTAVLVSPTFSQLTDEGFFGPGLNATKRTWEEDAATRARTVLDAVAAAAKAAGVICATEHVFHNFPYQAIIDTAKKYDCDLIVMGSHGYGGFKQLVLGSETMRVLSHSKIPVLVYR
jgi:nucleotide-binding universal stress UspA family protein